MGKLGILLKRNFSFVILSVITLLIANSSQLVYTFQIGRLVNTIENREAISGAFAALLVFFLFSNAATQYVYQYVSRYTAERTAHSLRIGFIRAVMYNDSQSGISTDGAKVMSTVQNELVQSSEYLCNNFFELIGSFLTGIFVLIFLLLQNVMLTLVIVLPTLFIMVYVVITSRKLSHIISYEMDEKEKMNRTACVAIECFPAIRIFGAKGFVDVKYTQSLERWGVCAVKEERMYALFNSISGMLSRLPLLLLLLTGGLLVIRGNITLGTLIVFINLQKSLTNMIMNLPMQLARLKAFTVNLSRIPIRQVQP